MPKETTKKSTKTATEASGSTAKPRAAKKEKNTDDKPARKTKAKKDPNAPKKPLSGYMYFSLDWRERVKTESPDATFGETGKILGAKWKELSESDRKPYEAQAATDKKRYAAAKEEYENGGKVAKAKAKESEEDEEDDE